MKKYSHSIITLVLMLVAVFFGVDIYALPLVSGFWLGREHSQAEYKYMKLRGINRDKLCYFDGFKREAWNYDSLVNDLVVPVVIGILILLVFH